MRQATVAVVALAALLLAGCGSPPAREATQPGPPSLEDWQACPWTGPEACRDVSVPTTVTTDLALGVWGCREIVGGVDFDLRLYDDLASDRFALYYRLLGGNGLAGTVQLTTGGGTLLANFADAGPEAYVLFDAEADDIEELQVAIVEPQVTATGRLQGVPHGLVWKPYSGEGGYEVLLRFDIGGVGHYFPASGPVKEAGAGYSVEAVLELVLSLGSGSALSVAVPCPAV